MKIDMYMPIHLTKAGIIHPLVMKKIEGFALKYIGLEKSKESVQKDADKLSIKLMRSKIKIVESLE